MNVPTIHVIRLNFAKCYVEVNVIPDIMVGSVLLYFVVIGHYLSFICYVWRRGEPPT